MCSASAPAGERAAATLSSEELIRMEQDCSAHKYGDCFASRSAPSPPSSSHAFCLRKCLSAKFCCVDHFSDRMFFFGTSSSDSARGSAVYVYIVAVTATQRTALLIQSCIQGFIARRYFSAIREQKAALMIQSFWRKRKIAMLFQRYKQAAIAIQCAWRQKLARRELRKLRMGFFWLQFF
ncbi:hypothetical protein ZWY2020_029234 [Hordeum vulgare]|nr:hypothetical protein ZWY2020_029234 [Hordeum vulgare]